MGLKYRLSHLRALFGFVDGLQPSFGDLYNSDARDLICNSDSRPVDLPPYFILALVSHLVAHVDEATAVYPLCFEELSIWLVRDFNLLFPFVSFSECRQWFDRTLHFGFPI